MTQTGSTMAGHKRRPLIAGNWKMNGLKIAGARTLGQVIEGYDAALRARADLLVCPPAPLLYAFAAASIGSGVAIGAQTCHPAVSGACTGEISAEMLADAGASAVIVGHSERRAYNGETDADVRARAEAARRAGLTPIVCVGETREERDAGRALDVVGAQLAGSVPDGEGALIVAYEPVWAIGTGLTPTVADVAEVHAFMRAELRKRFGAAFADDVRLLYGGSVKPSNAAELMAVEDVDGALVGGASLVAADFLAIAAGC
ncbi:triose-phosphate isomerase [Camelimonas fluminis]|uniref:Triosephosphate isomerase n=1 Tax=Camelimonas fluminis TaxID=1576911 RepID=A0ABV7UDW4_9HYPH|nr:triose-phosphate isomerase [Camelimonas fluminis]